MQEQEPFNVSIAGRSHEEARLIAEHVLSYPVVSEPLAELPTWLPPKDPFRMIPIPEEANLGLATTEQLLNELRVRGEVESVNVYQAAGQELAEEAKRLLAELPPAMKAYRTVDPK